MRTWSSLKCWFPLHQASKKSNCSFGPTFYRSFAYMASLKATATWNFLGHQMALWSRLIFRGSAKSSIRTHPSPQSHWLRPSPRYLNVECLHAKLTVALRFDLLHSVWINPCTLATRPRWPNWSPLARQTFNQPVSREREKEIKKGPSFQSSTKRVPITSYQLSLSLSNAWCCELRSSYVLN